MKTIPLTLTEEQARFVRSAINVKLSRQLVPMRDDALAAGDTVRADSLKAEAEKGRAIRVLIDDLLDSLPKEV